MISWTKRRLRLVSYLIATLSVAVLAAVSTGAVAAIVAGSTPATFAVSSTGSAQYSVPIWTPPGVGQVQLPLALTYNSRTPNGVVGMGWSLSGLSAVSRCKKTFTQDGAPGSVLLQLSDRFCLDGQQLKLVSGTYGQAGSVYATEIESFSRIEASGVAGSGPASFKVTTKNGLIYEYGITTDSRITLGGGTTATIWALSRIRDRVAGNGNRIDFSYTFDAANNTYRIAAITYPTTASGQGPYYEVLFAYAARPVSEIPSSYIAGFHSREPNRLTTITIREFGSPTHVKRYELTYTQGTATTRSRLISIKECSPLNCLPETWIAYSQGTAGWSSTLQSTGQTTINSPVAGPIPVDLDGDGLTDVLYPKQVTTSTSRWWAILATASGFGSPVNTGVTTTNSDLEIVDAFSGSGQLQVLMKVGANWNLVQRNSSGVFTSVSTGVPAGTEYASVDWDGDGLPDLVSVVGNQFRVRRNTTTPPGPVTFAPTAETVFTYTGGWNIAGGTSYWLKRSDYNGDGRGDLYFLTYFNTGFGNMLQGQVLLSNGFGTQATNSSQLSSPGWTTLAGDWNADGCTDIVGNNLYISNCAGGFVQIAGGASGASSILATDWDGDSRTDLLYVNTSNNTWYLIRSTGEGAEAAVTTGIPAPLGTAWFVFDQDGDGLIDLGYRDVGSTPLIRYRLHNAVTVPPDLAASFTDGFGINQSPTYKSIARSNYTKLADATFPTQDFQGPLYVVDQFTASDGTGTSYQQQFWYYGAHFHTQGRGFVGFSKRRTIDNRNNLRVYDLFARAFPFIGMRVQRNVFQSNDTTPIGLWTGLPVAQSLGAAGTEQRKFPFIESTAHDRYEFGGPINGTLINTGTTQYVYGDGFGNLTSRVELITDKDPNSPFLNQTWQTTTSVTYQNDVTANCLGLPLSRSITSSVPGQTTKTRQFGYTNNVALCRLEQEVIEPNISSLKVTTNLGYEPSCGNLQSVQVIGSEPNGTPMAPRTTTLNYGTRCQLIETVTNALQQPTTLVYRYDYALPTSTSDPNGITTYFQYDDFRRRIREDRPDGTATTWAFERCAGPPCWGTTDLRLLVSEFWWDTADANVNTRYLFYDGLSRLRYDESYRVLGVWTNDMVLYDPLGRVTARYQPWSSQYNGHFAWIYDAIGRVNTARLFQPSGAIDRTMTYQYAGRTRTMVDPLGRTTQHVLDVTSKLRRVFDPYPGGTTSYDYDAFGNLNKITDPIDAISTGTYNLRGFKTQWADIDRGVWNFTPNSLNELVAWTDARSQVFSAEYDNLGRLRKRFEPEGMSEWTWGSVATENNIGVLKSKSGLGFLEEYFYDGAGRLANRRITSDQQYNYDYTYNSIGALDTITYPASPIPSGHTGSRFKIQYDYSYGAPFQIRNVTEPTSSTLWTLNAANDYSSVTSETLGTAPTTTSVTNGYKQWTNELTSIQSGVGLGLQTNRQNLAYQWDTAGNLIQRQDLNQGLTEVFVPDALDRILSSTLNGVPNLAMVYDQAGNIKEKSGVTGTYDYGPTQQAGCTYYAHNQPHAVRSAGGIAYCYDQNGNLVKRDGLTQTWASFNLPTLLQANVGGSTYQSQFFYGPDHQRWKQIATYSNGTETTHYVGGLLEKMHATSTPQVTYWRHYVPTPSGLTIIVSRNSDSTTSTIFALSDHLGSSDVLLRADAGIKVRESFDAFGARRGSNWSATTPPDWAGIADATRRGFTFHEMLDNIGLIHMNSRVYDPAIGRFMSVDPLIASLTDSQSVNPYSYVGNRPLSYTDPTGFGPDDFDNQDDGGGGNPIPPGCNPFCDPNGPGSWDWWDDFFDDIGDFFDDFDDIFDSDPPPPPPATTWPGTSSQNGVNMCDPGMGSPSCAGGLPSGTAGLGPAVVIGVPVLVGGILVCPAIEGCRESGEALGELIVEVGKLLSRGLMCPFGICMPDSGRQASQSEGVGKGKGPPTTTAGETGSPTGPDDEHNRPSPGKRKGKAPEFKSGRLTGEEFLRAAEEFLGPNFRHMGNNRYVSSDGMRQVRIGEHELKRGNLHGHFEVYNQPGGTVTETATVEIIPIP